MDTSTPLAPETIDWDGAFVELTGYVAFRARHLAWRTGKDSLLPGANLYEDIALDAIEKVWTGERAWDPSRCTLMKLLKGIVHSSLNHLVMSGDNTHRRPLPGGDNSDAVDRCFRPEVPIDDRLPFPQKSIDPEYALLEHHRLDHQLQRVRMLVADDDRLSVVLKVIIDRQVTKPAVIASILGWPVEDVYRDVRRLRRLVLDDHAALSPNITRKTGSK